MDIRELKQLNEYLKNLDKWTLNRSSNIKILSEYTPENYYSNKDQEVEGERWIVCQLPINDIKIKVTYVSDSYGTEMGIKGIEFVDTVVKTIQVYE